MTSKYGMATSSSMAGVVLRATETEVRCVLGPEICTDRASDLTIMRYEGLEVFLDEGAVTMIVATAADSVETAAGIRVGMTWRELVAAVGDLEYGEEEALWVCSAEPRIWYQILEVVRPPGESEILVFPDQTPSEDARIELIFFMDPIASQD